MMPEDLDVKDRRRRLLNLLLPAMYEKGHYNYLPTTPGTQDLVHDVIMDAIEVGMKYQRILDEKNRSKVDAA